jgi:hypothetical protein
MKKGKSFKIYSLLTLVVISGLFAFLRLYKINTSLLFYNDMGRDLNILFDWHQTGKPPLLGPKTSVVPTNQTAFYFYLLYPLFVLTGHSAFSTIYTVILFYLAVFVFGFIVISRQKPKLLKFWLISWFLIAIHPQFIYQNRFVWNPSFVAPMLALAVLFFYLLEEKFTRFRFLIFCLSISMATAFSYSVAPVFIAFILYILVFRQKKLVYLIGIGSAFALSHLPTIFFELRHNFPLTKLMLNRPMLKQAGTSLATKLNTLFGFVVHPQLSVITMLALITIVLIVFFEFIYFKTNKKENSKLLRQVGFLFLITTGLIVFIPFTLHAHFIFGILTLGFFIISLLPLRSAIPVLIITSLLWLHPNQLKKYFSPAKRTVAQTIDCAQRICQQETAPMYLSVEAGNHPYHSGPEFRYFFKQAGCTILDIEKSQDQAKKMVVVADGAEYNHNQTDYYELDLFGRSKEVKQYNCLPSLQVHILEKE